MVNASYENKSYNASTVTGSHGSRVTDVETDFKVGQAIPNFRKRLVAGELLPHTAYRRHKVVGTYSAVLNYRVDYSYGWYSWHEHSPGYYPSPGYSVHPESPFMGGTTVLPYYWISESEALAYADDSYLQGEILRAQAKIYSSGHDSLTFIAELAKVRQMFQKRALGLLGKPPPGGPSKSIPGGWLEWRYGWRTLMYDIRDLAEAVDTLQYKRTRFSERSGFRDQKTDVVYGNETAGSIDTYVNTITTVVDISYRGSVTADINPPSFGFNPVTTAWELLPYSFIVDWFIGVGAFLESLSFATLSKASVSSGGISVRLDREQERRVLTWKNVAGGQYSGTREQNFTVSSETYKRIPLPASNFPPIRVKVDSLKVLDLLALIIQRFK